MLEFHHFKGLHYQIQIRGKIAQILLYFLFGPSPDSLATGPRNSHLLAHGMLCQLLHVFRSSNHSSRTIHRERYIYQLKHLTLFTGFSMNFQTLSAIIQLLFQLLHSNDRFPSIEWLEVFSKKLASVRPQLKRFGRGTVGFNFVKCGLKFQRNYTELYSQPAT